MKKTAFETEILRFPNQYTTDELRQIFEKMAPQRLLVPMPAGAPPAVSGPAVCVRLRHTEVVPGSEDIEKLYRGKLRQVPVVGGVGVLASINSLLSEHRSGHPALHSVLNGRYLSSDLIARVGANQVAGPGFVGVFTRIGCLQLMRHLLLYGNGSLKTVGQSEKLIGELVLLTNEFLPDAARNPSPDNLDLLLSFLPVWDIYNPRDLAYALSRMHTILTEILPGNDSQVRALASKVGLNPSAINVGSLPLNDFIAAVFGLFAYGRQLKGPEHAIFDVRVIFSKVGFPEGILKKLVSDRALTAQFLRRQLSGGVRLNAARLREELGRAGFLTESLNIFRQHPLMKLDANRVLILDLDSLVELLTSGVYWSIFDSLPPNRRETFKELWGRLFEIYGVDLLAEFYPRTSQVLAADLLYSGGQVDALLDFGPVVVVFEIKSSLLTEAAKRSGSKADFVRDFALKFVRNQKGKPKALLQLAASCKAVEDGTIATAMRPARIFPVCISDEPAVESFFFTAYANEIFQKELASGSHIQPVTMMSINELEEILPYVSDNAFTWEELLDFRLKNLGGAFSVHQAIYDLLRAKGLPPSRNQAVRRNFDEVWRIIGGRYKPPAAA